MLRRLHTALSGCVCFSRTHFEVGLMFEVARYRNLLD